MVELVLVITILSVLSTIAFLSFSQYTVWARDSVRLADIKTIYTGLNHIQIKNWSVPAPENFAEIKILWETIQKQGDLWPGVLAQIWVSVDTRDPVTQELYIYITNKNQTKHQVGWFLELNNPSYAYNTVYAKEKIFYGQWERMWIIEDTSWDLVHKIVTSFNIADAIWNLTCYFDSDNIFVWTGPELVNIMQGN